MKTHIKSNYLVNLVKIYFKSMFKIVKKSSKINGQPTHLSSLYIKERDCKYLIEVLDDMDID